VQPKQFVLYLILFDNLKKFKILKTRGKNFPLCTNVHPRCCPTIRISQQKPSMLRYPYGGTAAGMNIGTKGVHLFDNKNWINLTLKLKKLRIFFQKWISAELKIICFCDNFHDFFQCVLSLLTKIFIPAAQSYYCTWYSSFLLFSQFMIFRFFLMFSSCTCTLIFCIYGM